MSWATENYKCRIDFYICKVFFYLIVTSHSLKTTVLFVYGSIKVERIMKNICFAVEVGWRSIEHARGVAARRPRILHSLVDISNSPKSVTMPTNAGPVSDYKQWILWRLLQPPVMTSNGYRCRTVRIRWWLENDRFSVCGTTEDHSQRWHVR